MTRRKRRSDGLAEIIRSYCKGTDLPLIEFSEIHFRLSDDYTVMDVWPTTGKYYISKTSYHKQTDASITERAGEKGLIPFGTSAIEEFIDCVFFAADMAS